VGHSELWDVLRVGRFKSRMFSDGMFREWDVSRAGPFVYSPSTVDGLKMYFSLLKIIRHP
jgi:hypothetical protein